MKNRMTNVLVFTVAILAFSSSAYAGCTKPQVSGVWEVAFSDGNSCRLKLNNTGKIVTSASVCFDPDLGAAAPDSGKLAVAGNCFIEGDMVVQGVTTNFYVQISHDRSTGAGRYRQPSSGAKGSVVMVRVP